MPRIAQNPAHYLTPLSADRCREPDEDDDDFGDGLESQPELFPRPKPDEPTFLVPGSDEKIELLAKRYDEGCVLWHEDDLTAFAGDIYSVID